MKKIIVGLVALLALTAPAAAQQSVNIHKATIGGLVYDSTAGNIAGGCQAVSGTFPKQTITGASVVDARTTTSEALADSDRCKLVTFSNGSAVAATIAQAGSGGNFASGWIAHLVNLGAGTVTLTPTTSTINGASTLTLTTGQGADIYSNGVNYFAQVGSGSGGGGAPGGSNGDIQYNNSGSFGGRSLSATIDTLGSTQGDILYRNGAAWVVLGPGTSGQALESGGASANPSWATLSGTGTVTSVICGTGLTGGTITTTGTCAIDLTAVNAYTGAQYSAEATLTDAGPTTWDLATQQEAHWTLGANRTLSNPTNQHAGLTANLRIIQDGTGSRIITWSSDYKFPGGTPPVLSTAAGAVDLLSCYSDGTDMLCNLSKAFN